MVLPRKGDQAVRRSERPDLKRNILPAAYIIHEIPGIFLLCVTDRKNLFLHFNKYLLYRASHS